MCYYAPHELPESFDQIVQRWDTASKETELADKGYDSDAIIEQATQQGMKAQIPPRKNRKGQRGYDEELYKLRHLVENAFCISSDGEGLPLVAMWHMLK